MTERHPFVKATLQKAIRTWLRDKHGHTTPTDMLACAECVERLWPALGDAAPVPWIGSE